MSRRIRLWLLIFGVSAVFGLLVASILFWAASYKPDFYGKAMATDVAILEKGSDDMLRQTAALASLVKKKEPWEVLFTADQINGWFAVDMTKNHPDALPSTMHDPRIVIDSNRVTLACRYQWGWIDSVLSLTVEPSIVSPNVVAIRIVKARAGLLPTPLGNVVERIQEAARGMDCHVECRYQGGSPVVVLAFPQSDKRPASIRSIRLGKDEIYFAGNASAESP